MNIQSQIHTEMNTFQFKIAIYLYSKYSIHCQRLASLFEYLPFKIENICIDNKNIKESILSSSKIRVNSVPCLLFVYENGIIEKYEGSETFNLVNEITKAQQKSIPGEKNMKKVKFEKHVEKRYIPCDDSIESTDSDNSDNSDSDFEEKRPKNRKSKSSKKNPNTKRKSEKTGYQKSSKKHKSKLIDIEDIDDLDDLDDNEQENIDSIGSKTSISMNPQTSSSVISSSNIMQKAMEMQQMRDIEVEEANKKIKSALMQ